MQNLTREYDENENENHKRTNIKTKQVTLIAEGISKFAG